MPIYEFRCLTCDTQFEKLVNLSQDEEVACPHCGGTALRRLMSTFASKVKVSSLGAPIVRSHSNGGGG